MKALKWTNPPDQSLNEAVAALEPTEHRDIPDTASYAGTVGRTGPEHGCEQFRSAYKDRKTGYYYAAPWGPERLTATRVTIDGHVWEGRVPSVANAVQAVLTKRDFREAVGLNPQSMLIGVERICHARHAKMTKVSE